MFFKSLFKPKKSSKLITKFFDTLNKTHFPGGEEQIQENVQTVRKILKNKIDQNKARRLLFITKAMLFMNKSRLPEMIEKEIGEFINKVELIELITYITFNDVNEQLVKLTTQGYNFMDEGFDDDEIPFAEGDFGKCNTNPIPTKGIVSNDSYLEQIKTIKGDTIKWQRIKSEESKIEQIKGPIDIYEITTEDGQKIEEFYLSPYNKKTSNKAPAGFIIEKGYTANSDEDLQKKVNLAWQYKKNGKLLEGLGIYNQIYSFICKEAADHVRTNNVVDEGNTRKILPSYFSEADKYLKQGSFAYLIANNMGTIFAELGDKENAKKMFEESIRLTPNNIEYSDPKIGLEELKN